MGLRTGAEYRESLRDGRQVGVQGERVLDVTTPLALWSFAHQHALCRYGESGTRTGWRGSGPTTRRTQPAQLRSGGMGRKILSYWRHHNRRTSACRDIRLGPDLLSFRGPQSHLPALGARHAVCAEHRAWPSINTAIRYHTWRWSSGLSIGPLQVAPYLRHLPEEKDGSAGCSWKPCMSQWNRFCGTEQFQSSGATCQGCHPGV